MMNQNPFLSIVIPAHNEEENISVTCRTIQQTFKKNNIEDYEILVINDGSSDRTESVLKELSERSSKVWYKNNIYPKGFGSAIRYGLDLFRGEAICLVMADGSDLPEDILSYYHLLKDGYDCAFGCRFIGSSAVHDYPKPKLFLNRIANLLIQWMFGIDHNDITNAFKAYRRKVIESSRPVLSNHFEITIELPLKAIIYGFKYAKIPISWTNRAKGITKFKIKEMGSRYLFMTGLLLREKWTNRFQEIPQRVVNES